MSFEEHYGKSFETTPSAFKSAFEEVWNAAQEEYKQRVREVLEKHARKPIAEGQSCQHQMASRKAEAKIKAIIEELGL